MIPGDNIKPLERQFFRYCCKQIARGTKDIHTLFFRDNHCGGTLVAEFAAMKNCNEKILWKYFYKWIKLGFLVPRLYRKFPIYNSKYDFSSGIIPELVHEPIEYPHPNYNKEFYDFSKLWFDFSNVPERYYISIPERCFTYIIPLRMSLAGRAVIGDSQSIELDESKSNKQVYSSKGMDYLAR